MTVDVTKTKLLKSAIDCQKTSSNSVLEWLHDDSRISGTLYSEIVSDFAAWKAAYEETPSDLYVTVGSGTQQLSGIDQFPIPPSR